MMSHCERNAYQYDGSDRLVVSPASAPFVTVTSPKGRRLTDIDRRMDEGERFSSGTGV